MKVCLAPTRVLACPDLGGHAWVYLNWTLGLRANGCEVVWLERLPRDATPARAVELLRAFARNVRSIGLDVPLALVIGPEQRAALAPCADEIRGSTVPLDAALEGADLLLDFFYESEPALVARFQRTALVDIDPGLLQMWMHEGQLDVAEHDLHFTIGETVGTPGARFPACGRRWIHTPPPVDLAMWPTKQAEASAPFTTVSSWFQIWQCFGGVPLADDKRISFLQHVELPRRTSVPLELALSLGDGAAAAEDGATLRANGWRLRPAAEVAASPHAFRDYVQASRGEIGCARPSYVRMETAWISDRTPCYLASGHPAVVQHTGESSYLPEDEGLFRFRDVDGAARAFAELERDYDRHARAARALAEERFDSRRVVGRVLERVMALEGATP